jgi:NAD+ kinase
VVTSGRKKKDTLYAINDLVISKGEWPKMIEITLEVDNRLVTTFAADGIIIATPTGSTGYSLSVNGPIVHPKADAITLNPIAPHTLTIRPLVLSSYQKIRLIIDSPHRNVHVNCDGQRVYYFEPRISLEIYKGEQPMRLVRSKKTNYFDILRSKLLWGLDLRNKNGENGQ